MAVTRYTQNVAIEQVPAMLLSTLTGVPFGSDGIGGGPITGPSFLGFPVQISDPGVEIGAVKTVTAIYQLYGNETVGDIINIYMAQPGSMIDPAFSSVSCASAATTLTLTVGDDDTTGYGLVSSGVAFTATPLPGTTFPGAITPQGASASRYSTAITLSGTPTNPVAFVGGSAFVDPYVIGTFATEPPGSTATPGYGVAGSWIQATISTIAGQTSGKVLVFRLRVIKP